jgi:glycogen operon protein
MVNAAHDGVEFTLPPPPANTPWRQVLDTQNIEDPFAKAEIGDKVILGGRSLRVFCDGKG